MTTKLHIALIALAIALSMGQTAPAPTTTPGLVVTDSVTLPSPPEFKGNRITEDPAFGTMADNSPVKLFTLANAQGTQVRICTFGGTIDGVKVADAKGSITNVCACADNFQTLQRFNMQAQTIGRYANRIAGGKFTIDGTEYTVGTGTVLHSGTTNFGTKNWQGKTLPAGDHSAACELTITSKDGDGGFPGNFTLKVTYALSDDNALSLTYEATSDKSTPVNVTNHAYWNLAGAPGWGNANPGRGAAPAGTSQGTAQELWIDADKYLLADSGNIPTGQMTPVKDTAFDFTKPALLNSRTTQLAPARIYDHAYVLNSGGKLAVVARLRDPQSGRQMEVSTDQPGLMLYTGQAMGVALETQHHPDSVHREAFPTTILKAGATFKTTTIYAFSAK